MLLGVLCLNLLNPLEPQAHLPPLAVLFVHDLHPVLSSAYGQVLFPALVSEDQTGFQSQDEGVTNVVVEVNEHTVRDLHRLQHFAPLDVSDGVEGRRAAVQQWQVDAAAQQREDLLEASGDAVGYALLGVLLVAAGGCSVKYDFSRHIEMTYLQSTTCFCSLSLCLLQILHRQLYV